MKVHNSSTLYKKDLIYIKASYFFLGTILCLLCSKMRLCNADTNQVTIIFLFTVITISSLITNSGGSKVQIDKPFKRLHCSRCMYSINIYQLFSREWEWASYDLRNLPNEVKCNQDNYTSFLFSSKVISNMPSGPKLYGSLFPP